MYSKTLAYLLWLFSGFGALGFHRFYLGKPLSALLWMFTGGLCGVGALYDLITLGRQVDLANAEHLAAVAGAASRTDTWRYVNDGVSHIVNGKADEKDGLDKIILKTARKNGGIVTPAEVTIEGNVPLETARKHLEKMVTDGHAEMRVRKSGVIAFTFPEFMDGDSDFEAL
jgi:TM2 domain-containing membrane protein YozV